MKDIKNNLWTNIDYSDQITKDSAWDMSVVGSEGFNLFSLRAIWLNRLLRRVKEIFEGNTLEIGCCQGNLTSLLPGRYVKGWDKVDKWIEEAKEKYWVEGLIEFEKKDILKDNIEDEIGYWTTVILSEVLYFFEDKYEEGIKKIVLMKPQFIVLAHEDRFHFEESFYLFGYVIREDVLYEYFPRGLIFSCKILEKENEGFDYSGPS